MGVCASKEKSENKHGSSQPGNHNQPLTKGGNRYDRMGQGAASSLNSKIRVVSANPVPIPEMIGEAKINFTTMAFKSENSYLIAKSGFGMTIFDLGRVIYSQKSEELKDSKYSV